MPSQVARKSTKYQELTHALREQVRTLRPGDRFPSQSELMRLFHVSDRTVLRALEDLTREGWIVRRHGSGTFVADPSQRVDVPALTIPAVPATRSDTICALVLALGPVYQHFMELLTAQADAAGLALVCHLAHREDSFEDAVMLEALQPRGFILFSYYLLPIAEKLIEKGHRVVIVGAPPAGVSPQVSCVYNDQDLGGEQATRHLLDLGHRRIAYVIPEVRYPLQDTQRWQGHCRAVEEAKRAGLSVVARTVELDEWLPWRDDPEICAAFFRRPDAPTALLAWNDDKAVELLNILYRAGIRVPRDVSLVGYDALPIGERSIPQITTVDSHIGTQIRAVLRFLTQPYPAPPTQSMIATPTLLPRASSAPPLHR